MVRMLTDELLPEYAASLRRAIVIEAPAARVYAAILATDLHGSRSLRVLRPSFGWSGRWHPDVAAGGEPPLRLLDLRRFGVAVLAERPSKGIALGALALLWSVRPDAQRIPAGCYASATKTGFVKIVAACEVTPIAEDEARLECEVRFFPLDRAASRRFRLGWPVGWMLTRLALRDVMGLIAKHAVSGQGIPTGNR